MKIISNGKTLDVAKGKDGFSPTVEVTDIDGGHRVEITDINGSKTFDVMDGSGGSDDVVKSEWVSPFMTNNTNPTPYVASASSEYSNQYSAYMGFDGNYSTLWHSKENDVNGAWLSVDFGGKKTISGVRLIAPTEQWKGQLPRVFRIEGSNDGIEWDVIKNVSDPNTQISAGEVKEHIFDGPVGYRYYRIYIISIYSTSAYSAIGDILFRMSSSNGDIYSTEETRIGTWIDGKPLYRVVIEATIYNIENINVVLNTNDLHPETFALVNSKLIGATSGYEVFSGYSDQNGYYFTNNIIPVKTIQIFGKMMPNLFGDAMCITIVEYTKTTDVPATSSMNSISTSEIPSTATTGGIV